MRDSTVSTFVNVYNTCMRYIVCSHVQYIHVPQFVCYFQGSHQLQKQTKNMVTLRMALDGRGSR